MESIKNMNQEIKLNKPVSENEIIFIDVPEKPKETTETITKYNLNHTQSQYYYKAHTETIKKYNVYEVDDKKIKEDDNGHYYVAAKNERITNKIIIVGVSYETPITLLDNETGTLLINLDYYHSSKTTKEHYNTFIQKYKYEITGKILLNDELFTAILSQYKNEPYYRFKHAIEYLNHAANYEKPIFNILQQQDKNKAINELLQQIGLNLQQYLQGNQKIIKKYASKDLIQDHQTEELKTREKHTITLQVNRVKIEISFSCRKRSKTILSQIKYKILPEEYLTQDLRTTQDKTLYGGYDMGVTNTKNLTYKGGCNQCYY